MRVLVDGVDVSQSEHGGKRILLDTVILCYAHDLLSPIMVRRLSSSRLR